jgi:hypothetical protein
MKKQLIYLLLFFAFHSSVNAQKTPTKLGVIKEFSGVIEGSFMYDGTNYFTIKDSKIGKIEFYFQTEMDDKYKIDCNIDEELSDLQFGDDSVKGKKVKVKAKSAYGVFFNYRGGKDQKKIIWRPIEVIEL